MCVHGGSCIHVGLMCFQRNGRRNNQTGYNAEINGEQDYRPCQIGRKAS